MKQDLLILFLTLTGLASASDPETGVVAHVPQPILFLSSHATAAAAVLEYHGLKPEGLPEVVLIGGLAAQMYRCDCAKNLDYWDVAGGIQRWVGLYGGEREERGEGRGRKEREEDRREREGLHVVQKCRESADAAEVASFAGYCREIDTGRPVIVTVSFAAAEAAALPNQADRQSGHSEIRNPKSEIRNGAGLEGAYRSQCCFSVVGVGYWKGNWETGKLGNWAAKQEKLGNQPQPPEPVIPQFPSATLGTSEKGWLVVQVPEGKVPEKEKAAWQRFQELLRPCPEETYGQAGRRGQETRAEPGGEPVPSAIRHPPSTIPQYLLPWDFPEGNLVLTFVWAEGLTPAREATGNGRRAVPPTNPPTAEGPSPSPPFPGAGTEAPPLQTGLRLLVTAGMRGVLEPCECGEEMRGGLARRATLLKQLSSVTGDEWRVTRDSDLSSPILHPSSLIPRASLRIECGDLLGEGGKVEKAEPLLRALQRMGVEAAVLGPGDLAHADDLQAAAEAVGRPLLRPTRETPWPGLRLAWGRRTLGLLALFPPFPEPDALAAIVRSLRKQVDLICAVYYPTEAEIDKAETDVGLAGVGSWVSGLVGSFQSDADEYRQPTSQPANQPTSVNQPTSQPANQPTAWESADQPTSQPANQRRNLDLLLLPSAAHPATSLERVGDTWLVRLPATGEVVTALDLELSLARTLERVAFQDYPITKDLVRDEAVDGVVQAYYARVAERLLADTRHRVMERGYVPAAACGQCHEAAYTAWQRQAHAQAYQTLVGVQRQHVPECLTCHAEFYRRTQQASRTADEQAGVECSTCHGDGLLHALNPARGGIVKAPDEPSCRACHTAARSPSFDYARYAAQIPH